jgi:hypothetical protein
VCGPAGMNAVDAINKKTTIERFSHMVFLLLLDE